MKHLSEQQDDSGDFSTSFGDMVFGLLFFFFVLSLIMVFNRPDVSKFQEEQDNVLREIQQKEVENAKLKRQIELIENRVSRLKDEKKTLFNTISETATELDEKSKKVEELGQEKSNLDFRLKKLREKYYEQPDTTNKVVQLERELDLKTAVNQSLQEDLKKAKIDYEKIKRLFTETERLLESRGHRKILAEIDELKKGQERQPEETSVEPPVDTGRETGSNKPPPDIIGIYVKLFANNRFAVRVMSGNSKVVDLSDASENDIIKLAQEAEKVFKENADGYSQEEKQKYRPRLFLMTHPDTPYGIVEGFLKKIREVLAIKILEWKE